MKQALILAIATFGLATAAFAQAPDTGASPGPHDPNPPLAAPDLRLPPPCAPTANLASAGLPAKNDPAYRVIALAGRVVAVDSGSPTQCSANSITQSAELPLSPSAAQ
jgi:hypothetical protein